LSELAAVAIRADLIEFLISRCERNQANNFVLGASRLFGDPLTCNVAMTASRIYAAVKNHPNTKDAFVTSSLT
jgi:hypothetical protein